MSEIRSRVVLRQADEEESFTEVFRVLAYFFGIFFVIYFFYSISLVAEPGASRFSVSCGLDNPVQYRHAGIYWKAGCTPSEPFIRFG